MRIELRAKYTTMVNGTMDEMPQQVTVFLTTPEARTIANGGELPPVDLFDGEGWATQRIGVLRVKRETP